MFGWASRASARASRSKRAWKERVVGQLRRKQLHRDRAIEPELPCPGRRGPSRRAQSPRPAPRRAARPGAPRSSSASRQRGHSASRPPERVKPQRAQATVIRTRGPRRAATSASTSLTRLERVRHARAQDQPEPRLCAVHERLELRQGHAELGRRAPRTASPLRTERAAARPRARCRPNRSAISPSSAANAPSNISSRPGPIECRLRRERASRPGGPRRRRDRPAAAHPRGVPPPRARADWRGGCGTPSARTFSAARAPGRPGTEGRPLPGGRGSSAPRPPPRPGPGPACARARTAPASAARSARRTRVRAPRGVRAPPGTGSNASPGTGPRPAAVAQGRSRRDYSGHLLLFSAVDRPPSPNHTALQCAFRAALGRTRSPHWRPMPKRSRREAVGGPAAVGRARSQRRRDMGRVQGERGLPGPRGARRSRGEVLVPEPEVSVQTLAGVAVSRRRVPGPSPDGDSARVGDGVARQTRRIGR